MLWVNAAKPVILPGTTGTAEPGVAKAMVVKTLDGTRTIVVAGWLQIAAGVRQASIWTIKISPTQQVTVSRPTVMPTPAGYASSVANGLNGAGEIVGHMTTSSGDGRAFIWVVGRGVYDLDSRLRKNSGWVITGARGVNSGGQIIAQGYWQGPSPSPPALQALILNPKLT